MHAVFLRSLGRSLEQAHRRHYGSCRQTSSRKSWYRRTNLHADLTIVRKLWWAAVTRAEPSSLRLVRASRSDLCVAPPYTRGENYSDNEYTRWDLWSGDNWLGKSFMEVFVFDWWWKSIEISSSVVIHNDNHEVDGRILNSDFTTTPSYNSWSVLGTMTLVNDQGHCGSCWHIRRQMLHW